MPLIKIQRISVLWQDNQLEYFPKFREKKKQKLPTTITVAALVKNEKNRIFFSWLLKN